ncbi:MAG: hypothetical protein ABEH81_12970 [Halopenitus sp.]
MSAPACHTSGGEQAACRTEWADDPRSEDKDALLKYTVEHPEGTPVVCAARDVLDPETEAGDADHRLALRFYRDHPEYFKTDRRDGLTWVWPRGPAFTRPANKHRPKHADGDGTGEDVPKANARAALGRRRTVESDGTRAYLLGALATYRETTEDRFHRLDRVRGDGPEHLLVPYSTRFNSGRRVGEARERFDGALAEAAREFDRAVCVSLTTDPSRFDSLLAATESLMGDVSRFKSWIATDARLGERPPSLVVPEFTDSGLPHAHVVLFGVSWVVPHGTLAGYWSGSRDRGSVVWFDRLVSRGERWRWAGDGPEDAEGRSPREYLGKTLGHLADLAESPPEWVREAARSIGGFDGENPRNTAERRRARGASECEALDRAGEWWKLACYWATETRLFTCSPSLKSPDDGETLPHIPRYRYVGTARLGEFPGDVRERAVVVHRSGRGASRPPPGAGGEPA